MDFHGSRFCMGIPPNHFAFWKTMLTIYRQLFNLFICWFVFPPELSTCATCALRSNLVAWCSLRKHGTPMRTFQAYLHCTFFISKRFESKTAWFEVRLLCSSSSASWRHQCGLCEKWSTLKCIYYTCSYIYIIFTYVIYVYLLNLLWCIYYT